MILLGSPGSGKTRLVRTILGEISRKILFTTNLPNVHDIDPALMRPGRCFATLHTRSLTPTEGSRPVRHQSQLRGVYLPSL